MVTPTRNEIWKGSRRDGYNAFATDWNASQKSARQRTRRCHWELLTGNRPTSSERTPQDTAFCRLLTLRITHSSFTLVVLKTVRCSMPSDWKTVAPPSASLPLYLLGLLCFLIFLRSAAEYVNTKKIFTECIQTFLNEMWGFLDTIRKLSLVERAHWTYCSWTVLDYAPPFIPVNGKGHFF